MRFVKVLTVFFMVFFFSEVSLSTDWCEGVYEILSSKSKLSIKFVQKKEFDGIIAYKQDIYPNNSRKHMVTYTAISPWHMKSYHASLEELGMKRIGSCYHKKNNELMYIHFTVYNEK